MNTQISTESCIKQSNSDLNDQSKGIIRYIRSKRSEY